jgi:hypothetical protein
MEVDVIEWLLDGDPAVRWQVMRDLLDEPEAVWDAERRRVVETGWAAALLARQGVDGEWPKGRWTASTWTLLLLVACGLPEDHPAGKAPVARLLDRFMPPGEEVDGEFLLKRVDLCHLGFWAGLGAHFLNGDPRLVPLAQAVLDGQLDDGGWNCHVRNHSGTRHSSFHTTFNVLEGLTVAAAHGAVDETSFREAEARAAELMLAHRLYRSDRTGEVISERFTHLTYPCTGITRCCAGSTTCGSRPLSRTSGSPTQSGCCGSAAGRTGAGRCRSGSRARCSSRWRGPAARAAGTRCASCAGTSPSA